jgi:hypothetical protein
VRSEPAETATEVTRLGLGTIVRRLEQTSSRERVGSLEDYWYRIHSPDGKEGWVFGGFTAPFEAAGRDLVYQKIAAGRLRADDASFDDLVDLVRFLSAAVGEVEDRSALAELELARLLALGRALEEIPVEKEQEPRYASWIRSQEESVVYNEPAGQWIARSDRFWELQEKYKDLAIAEQIAWEAANNPLPGECEGYFPCYIDAFNRTRGRYLGLYPDGAHAEEAMDEIATSLDELRAASEETSPPQREERIEARKELDKLRATVSKTTGKKKDELLERIDDYLKHYG